MTVSSALRNSRPERAENRIRNSPHCIGWGLDSWYFEFCDSDDDIDVLCLKIDTSSEVNNAFTELNSSTGVRGVNDANAVDRISRTYIKYITLSTLYVLEYK